MPGGDRTGPTGMGPMTGRAAGFCGGFGMPGYANPGPGRGYGMGFGRGGRGLWGRGFGGGFGGGRGWRHWYYATGLPGWMRFGGWAAPEIEPDPELEKRALKNQAEALQAQLQLLNERLRKIESEASAE